ncbi:SANT/Myb domain protein [Kalmanozyma brasiliensis GHG001]|uniref:SANT/Myb domain protein n=1 Tax=Kalmanozyma brasiliensis (strain GHG001) TaxID=1365824 RepID=UPI002868231D|nr:SANT/Myb domain protein [Kalmanozyma brasiliensis GHG001]EST09488.2 SANT/Myb domain protein [Kalmanozyma brasiliensis GHG001]
MDGRVTDPNSDSDPQAVLRQLIRQAEVNAPAATVPPTQTADEDHDSVSSDGGDDSVSISSHSSADDTDSAEQVDEQEDASSPPSTSMHGSTQLLSDEQLSATLASIAADRQELTTLLQHKRYLFNAQKRNVKHQRSLQKALDFLTKTREELKSTLRSLDVADVVDAEDLSLEVIRSHKLAEDAAATCPFSASMVQQIPLLRLQSIERAEYDNALGVRMWLESEDQQLRTAVKGAAMKARTMQLSMDPAFHGDALAEAANMDEETALRLAEELDAQIDQPSTSFQGRLASTGLDWATIAARMPTRSMEEVKTRWYGLLRPSVNTKPWSDQEVDDLIRLATPYLSTHLPRPQTEQVQEPTSPSIPASSASSSRASVPWQSIARELGTGRTAHACFVAFCSALVQRDQPDLTPAEDDNIKELFSLFRGAWRFMTLHASASPNVSLSALLPASSGKEASSNDRPPTLLGKVARDPQVVYRRFRNTLDPALATGSWSLREDTSLINAVRLVGQDNWAAVAARMAGRNSTQCRERWARRLKQVVAEADPADSQGELGEEQVAELMDRKKTLVWTKEMNDTLLSYLDDELKARDGRTFVSIAKKVSEQTGMALSDKSIRDHVFTLRRARARLAQAGGPSGDKDKGKSKELHEEGTGDDAKQPASIESVPSTTSASPSQILQAPTTSSEELTASLSTPKARPRTAIVPGAKRRKL